MQLLFKSKPKTASWADALSELEVNKTAVLIDVRTESEHQSGHVSGSKLIVLDVLKSQITSALPDKPTKIYLYCRSGMRSSNAAKQLCALGYTDVTNINGGIMMYEGTLEI